MKLRIFNTLFLAGLLGAALCSALGAPEATLTFRKVFKTSSPEYVEIKLNERGAGTCDIRQLNDPADPQPFEVGPQLTARMFALAAELHNFRDAHLDIRRRIANLGQKTFRYERGDEVYETTFNYTLESSANQLLQIFEGLALQQENLQTLQRTMKYDRLGVNDALLRLESDLNAKLIPEPERLVPILDQIAADPRFLDIARERARTLAARSRNFH